MEEAEKDAVCLHVGRMSPGKVLAYVVMPDHVHILYESSRDEVISKTLQALKGASSHTLVRQYGRKAPVWQEETFDHAVRSEKELLATWQYIEANPVRKGLVSAPGTYRWSSLSRA
ncbi:MAG: REP-associated tyrosine transposase [Acidobacteriota bacterium]